MNSNKVNSGYVRRVFEAIISILKISFAERHHDHDSLRTSHSTENRCVGDGPTESYVYTVCTKCVEFHSSESKLEIVLSLQWSKEKGQPLLTLMTSRLYSDSSNSGETSVPNSSLYSVYLSENIIRTHVTEAGLADEDPEDVGKEIAGALLLLGESRNRADTPIVSPALELETTDTHAQGTLGTETLDIQDTMFLNLVRDCREGLVVYVYV